MLKSPELDLPRGLSGAADLWDNDTAGRALLGDYFPTFVIRRFGDETYYIDTLPSSNGRASLKIHTLSEDGIVQSITCGFAPITEAGTSMRGLIYRVVAGVLTDLVAVGDVQVIPAGGGMITSITAATPLSAGDYAIGAVTNGSDAYHSHNLFGTGDGPDSIMANGTINFASPGPTWPGTSASYDYNVSAYATYAVGELPAGRSANTTVTLGAVTLACTATISQPGGGGGTGEFGDASAGTSSFPASGNRAILSRFLVPVDCDLTNLRLRFAASSGAGANAKGLVYADAAGPVPGARLGIGSAVAIPSGGGEVNSAISVSGLVGGTYVWLGSVTNSYEPSWSTDSSVGGGLSRMEGTTYTSPAATWTQSGVGVDRVNVVAEYSTGGGASGVIGNLTVALAAVTLAATSQLTSASAQANLSVALGPVVVAATAALALRAGGTNVLGAVSLAASARLAVAAGATVALGAVELSATASLSVQAGSTVALGAVGFSSTAAVGLRAGGTIQLDAVTLASTVLLVIGRAGNLSITLAPVTMAATARLVVQAGTTVTLGPVSLDSNAKLAVRAGGTNALGAVGLVSQSRLLLGAGANNELGAIAVAATAQLLQRAAAGITLDPVLLASTAKVTLGLASNLSVVLGPIGFSATATVTGEGIFSGQSVKLLVPKIERKFLVGVR